MKDFSFTGFFIGYLLIIIIPGAIALTVFELIPALNSAADRINGIPFLIAAADHTEKTVTWPWRTGSNYVHSWRADSIHHFDDESGHRWIYRKGSSHRSYSFDDERAGNKLTYLSVAESSSAKPPLLVEFSDGHAEWLLCVIRITHRDTSAHTIGGYLEFEASYSYPGHTKTDGGKIEFLTRDIPPQQSLVVKIEDVSRGTAEVLSVKVKRLVVTIDPEESIQYARTASARSTGTGSASIQDTRTNCDYPRKK